MWFPQKNCKFSSINGTYFGAEIDKYPMLAFKGHVVQILVTSLDVLMLRQTTHVQWASWAGVWPIEEWVTVASLSVSDSSMSRLKTALWKLDTQYFWNCRTWMQCGRHHRHSHSHTVLRTLSSALPPATPLADHSASTATTSSKLLQHKKICQLLSVQYSFTDFSRWNSIITTIRRVGRFKSGWFKSWLIFLSKNHVNHSWLFTNALLGLNKQYWTQAHALLEVVPVSISFIHWV